MIPRSYGNEQWEFDEAGLMKRREASINDVPIKFEDRRFLWPAPGARPADVPGLEQVPYEIGDPDRHRRGMATHVKAIYMRWKRGDSERGYHHGNLKEALIRAALDLIREKGPAGFTFADAARFAGVSPAAPYRHYRDRDDLLSDVAKRGFEEFEQRLSKAWDDGKPDPRMAFERLGKAYLAFARDEPAFYSAMFEAGLPQDISPELRAAGDRAFAVVRRACETVAALLPADKRPPALMMALHIWAFSHGIASLFARGDGAKRSLPMSAEDLLEAGVLVYLSGLGLHGKV